MEDVPLLGDTISQLPHKSKMSSSNPGRTENTTREYAVSAVLVIAQLAINHVIAWEPTRSTSNDYRSAADISSNK